MKHAFFFFLLLCFCIPSLHAADDELRTYRDELARALRSGNADSLAYAYCHIGEYYAYRDVDSTRHYCLLGLEHVGHERPEPYLILLNNLAESYVVGGELESAISLFREADAEALRLHYDEQGYRASVLTSLGVAYRRMELPDSALWCYNTALSLLGGEDTYDEEAHLLTSIAVLYANTSRLEEAEQYARRATQAADRCDDMDMVMYAYSTAGTIFALRSKNDEAARTIHPALAKARAQGKPRFELKAITYLLSMFHRMGNEDSINYYMHEAEQVLPQMPAMSAEVQGYRETLSEILTKMGRYRESLALQRLQLAGAEVNAQTSVDRLYLQMARNYQGLGDARQAARCYERAYALADSLHASDVETRLSEFSVQYETKEKELEIARLRERQLQQQARTIKWAIAAVVSLSVLLFAVLIYLFRRRRLKKEEELKVARSYIEGLERERGRLAKDLHDGVCNDLLGIGMQLQCLSRSEESRRLLALLEQVRSDVRSISHELMPPKFRHTTLDETVEAYIEHLALPGSRKITFVKENDGRAWTEIPHEVAYEVYRVLQELLSNIVKHSGATQVSVRLALSPSTLTLQVQDNGQPYEQALGNGIGLSTIEERAKAVGGRFTLSTQDGRQSRLFEVPLSGGGEA